MTTNSKTLKPNKKLLALWQSLTAVEKRQMAALAKRPFASFRRYIEGYRTINPDLAIKVEKACARMKLEPMNRTALNETCRNCEYAKFALKTKLD